jgi:hypothetical protein
MGAERSRHRQEHPGTRLPWRSLHRRHSEHRHRRQQPDGSIPSPHPRRIRERELIRERVIAGVRAAKARAKQVGRPKRIFRRDEAVRLRAEGKSWRSISTVLDVPVATVIDACKSRK